MFDIGANHGDWTRSLLRSGGKRIAKVYAFEPSAHNQADTQALRDSRVVLVPKAVSDTPGTATLHFDAPGSGLASLTKRRLTHHGIEMPAVETVQTTTIDDFMREQGLDRVDFAKVDIEGHELAALRGADKSLTAHPLAFEFGGTSIDTRTYFQDF